jgi:hypothetical protein
MITPTQSPHEALKILKEGLKSDQSVAYHLPSGHFYILEGKPKQDSVTHLPTLIFLASQLDLDTTQQQDLEKALKGRVSRSSNDPKLQNRLQAATALLKHAGPERQARDASLIDSFFFWINELNALSENDDQLLQECLEKGENLLEKLNELFPNSHELQKLLKSARSKDLISIQNTFIASPLIRKSQQILTQLRQIGNDLQERAANLRLLSKESLESDPPVLYVDIYSAYRELLEHVIYIGENLDEPLDILVSGVVCENYLLAKQALLQLDQWRENLNDETQPVPSLSVILGVSAAYEQHVQE